MNHAKTFILLAALAALFVGIGYLMEANVQADIERGLLIRVLEDWTPPLSDLCLYYPGRRNPSAALKAFVALARDFGRR